MNFSDVFTRCAPHFSAKPFCIFNGQNIFYPELAAQVHRLTASLIRMGAKKGACIVLLASNRPEWLVSFLAIMATGAVVVPINPGLAAPEVRAILGHCEPIIAIVQTELLDLLDGGNVAPIICEIGVADASQWHQLANVSPPTDHFADMQPDDPAMIFYTSGTTGTPKGVILSHGAELFAVEMFSEHLGITPADISLVTGPLAFIYHIVLHALTAINGGATLVLLDRFHPELACRAIERHRVSIMMAVPTVYVMMLNWSEGKSCDLSSMRYGITGGASFPAALSQQVRTGLGFPVFDLWVMTE